MVLGKGNRSAQQKRRRKNNKDTPILEDEYLLIDGNYSCQPAGYCCAHKGCLTNNQIQRHQCVQKNCTSLRPLNFIL